MKVLFALHFPGYLRFFDTTIRKLAERDHHVMLAFDSPEKQAEGSAALAGATGAIETVEGPPARGDAWDDVAQAVRGGVDYARYLDPYFADAPYLRDRMRKVLPPVFAGLGRFTTAGPATASTLVRWFSILEDAIPPSEAVDGYLRGLAPDLLVVSPLVMSRLRQVDLVKSARNLGIPSALCVASWDHLTTKGLMRVQPDCVVVWNETQKREAVDLHGAQPDRIAITGAQPFDRWFDREPSLSRRDFCQQVGLPADRPFLLFTGSSRSISAPTAEQQFVRQWIEALRGSTSPAVQQLSALIRPHPYNTGHWAEADFSGVANVSMYPRRDLNPLTPKARADYFDSLYHAVGVVGINTSAMIEAAVIGRPVHTVLANEFVDTQMGTRHFQHLLPENGGFLKVASNLQEHLAHLEETLEHPERTRAALARFVSTFVRPNGLDRACMPQLVELLEQQVGRAPVVEPVSSLRRWSGWIQLWWVRGAMNHADELAQCDHVT